MVYMNALCFRQCLFGSRQALRCPSGDTKLTDVSVVPESPGVDYNTFSGFHGKKIVVGLVMVSNLISECIFTEFGGKSGWFPPLLCMQLFLNSQLYVIFKYFA